MAIKTGFGTTITFGTSAFSFELTDVQGSDNDKREVIDSTHMGTSGGYVTKDPWDLRDGGSINVEGHFTGAQNPPSGAAKETITVDWGGTAKTWAFTGFMRNFVPKAPLRDKMTFSAVLEVAGAITKTVS